MNIVELAREAGIVAIHAEGATNWAEEVDALEHFADLVRAQALEEAAGVCLSHMIDGLLVHTNAVMGCAAAIRALKEKT